MNVWLVIRCIGHGHCFFESLSESHICRLLGILIYRFFIYLPNTCVSVHAFQASLGSVLMHSPWNRNFLWPLKLAAAIRDNCFYLGLDFSSGVCYMSLTCALKGYSLFLPDSFWYYYLFCADSKCRQGDVILQQTSQHFIKHTIFFCRQTNFLGENFIYLYVYTL